MKKLSFFPRTLATCSLLLAISACQKSDSSDSVVADTASDQRILSSFVDNVVLSTYQDLADRSAALDAAVALLIATPNETNWQAARTAWIETRIPWEQSEAFLFGPVDTFGFDPALDSWPLDHSGLNAAIAAYAKINVDTVDPSLKGFHAIEFILFGYERAKTLESLTSNEKSYLRALTQNHQEVTSRIVTAWKLGLNGQSPFADALKTAGASTNDLYPNSQAALEEMLEGMVGIADEVANNKIAQPFDQQDPNLVESQFSFNSLDDFQNNVKSIRYVWHGNRTGTATEDSLSRRVQATDSALNKKVEDAIDDALATLKAIPDPFRTSILDSNSRPSIVAAQEALRALLELLDVEVRSALAL